MTTFGVGGKEGVSVGVGVIANTIAVRATITARARKQPILNFDISGLLILRVSFLSDILDWERPILTIHPTNNLVNFFWKF